MVVVTYLDTAIRVPPDDDVLGLVGRIGRVLISDPLEVAEGAIGPA